MMNWVTTLNGSDVLGLIGVALYIGSYFLLQAGVLRGQGYAYAGLNTFAALCVLGSLSSTFNLSSAIIQVTYIGIGIFGIVRFYILTHRIRFSDEERACLNVLAPNLSAIDQRRFMNLGTWANVQPGLTLTTENEPVAALCFLLEGSADVFVGTKRVGEIYDASLIGELACLTGMPASATVTTSKPGRLFSLNVVTLKKYLDRNPAVQSELESRFANQIGAKLMRANRALSNQT